MALMRCYSSELWILTIISSNSMHFFDRVNLWLGEYWQKRFTALFLNLAVSNHS